jgi:Tol biopolymer transport system component
MPQKTSDTSTIMKRMIVLLVSGAFLLLLFCCQGRKQAPAPGENSGADLRGLQTAVPIPGRIVFQSDMDGDNEIYLTEGREVRKLTDNAREDCYPRWSPDGKKIAYTANPDGNFDIFVMDDQGRDVVQLTATPINEAGVAWSPDGKSLAFSEEVKKPLGRQSRLWIMDLSTKQKRRLIPEFSGSHMLPDFSPRSPRLGFTGKGTFGWDVFLYDLEALSIQELTKGGRSCRPRFSPDGQMIAYVSDQADGKGDIWIMAADGRNPERITERDEAYDYFPSWSPDGREIVFCSNFKDKYAEKGEWGLYLANLNDKSVVLLFDSPGKDVFPDWR